MIRALKFSAAALVLVVATLSIWHWRFEAVPDALPEMKLATPLVGWVAHPYCQYEVVEENGKPMLRLQREDRPEKLPSIQIWFGPLEDVANIHIRCKARWEDVVTGREGYTHARFVTMMKDAAGNAMHPPDFGITGGGGSRGWHHCESVFKLTDDMTDSGLEISMLGDSGLLEIRDLSITAVRNRGWVPAATTASLAGWVLFVALLMRCHPGAPPWWRSLSAGVAVVAVSWFFVFPQTKGMLHPVVGNFEIGKTDAPPPPPPPEPEPAVIPPPVAVDPAPPVREDPVVVTPAPEPVTPPAAEPKPEPEVRSSSALHKALRTVDKRLPVAHAGLFIGITLMVLFLTGRGNQWRVPLALAVLAELIPELTDHLGGWDDWTDVLQNFAGVGLAVLLWKRIPLLRRISNIPDGKPASPRAASDGL